MRGSARTRIPGASAIEDDLILASRNARKNRSFESDSQNPIQKSKPKDGVDTPGVRIRFADHSHTNLKMKPQTSLMLREISKVRREIHEKSQHCASAERSSERHVPDLFQIRSIENIYKDVSNAIKSAFPNQGM